MSVWELYAGWQYCMWWQVQFPRFYRIEPDKLAKCERAKKHASRFIHSFKLPCLSFTSVVQVHFKFDSDKFVSTEFINTIIAVIVAVLFFYLFLQEILDYLLDAGVSLQSITRVLLFSLLFLAFFVIGFFCRRLCMRWSGRTSFSAMFDVPISVTSSTLIYSISIVRFPVICTRFCSRIHNMLLNIPISSVCISGVDWKTKNKNILLHEHFSRLNIFHVQSQAALKFRTIPLREMKCVAHCSIRFCILWRLIGNIMACCMACAYTTTIQSQPVNHLMHSNAKKN